MRMSESLKTNALGIGVFSTFTAAIIAVTFVFTQAPITENIRQQKSTKLFEIIDKSMIDNNLLNDTLEIDGQMLGYDQKVNIYFATNNNQINTVIFPVKTSQGYSGDISLLVGINTNLSLAGVRVISHTETPGLGDKLEFKKSPWILSFDNKSKDDSSKWAVKKDGGDFDQFTGATITPRAVVNAVGNTLDYFKQNKSHLISRFNTGKTPNDH